jgi:hypothetical protein
VTVLLESLGYTDVKVSGRETAAEPARLNTPTDLKFDAPINVECARNWLNSLVDRDDVAIWGQEGDKRTFKVTCRLRDLRLSPGKTLELFWRAAAGTITAVRRGTPRGSPSRCTTPMNTLRIQLVRKCGLFSSARYRSAQGG